jgi:hypothetical protein
MARKLSLKSIEAEIRKTERQLRNYRPTTPLQKRRKARTLKKLDLMVKDLRMCCGGHTTYNPVHSIPSR